MREPELRVYLQKNGASGKDVETWIGQARNLSGQCVMVWGANAG